MFITVRLLRGYQEPLLYHVTSDVASTCTVGALVRVPFRTEKLSAFVTEIHAERPKTERAFTVRDVLNVEPVPNDEHYLSFVTCLAHTYHLDCVTIVRRIRHFLSQRELSKAAATDEPSTPPCDSRVVLTDEQRFIVESYIPVVDDPRYEPALIHGVTGSGKTEVYKKLIARTLEVGRSAMFLLPEVSLALTFETILAKGLCGATHVVRGFHSATPVSEKKQTWRMLINAEPVVLVGVHLPIFLPIANLGLIIVDEEHDVGYQEKRNPQINSKDAAIMRAHHYKIPIIMGSATPSLSSIYNVKKRGWRIFNLTKRYAGNFPVVKTVYLTSRTPRTACRAKANFWISDELHAALEDRLAKKEQSIIFINRRGLSFFVQCRFCNFVPSCMSCSVSLTLHEGDELVCHYCGFGMAKPQECPQCHKGSKPFVQRGIGTQSVVRIVEKLFPHAIVARADLDATRNNCLWQQTLTDFKDGAIDILVGTQTITKGFHFPRVTLVGILWADVNLHFPSYNASETTLQQIIQVAGRAGRQSAESLVIVQAMERHAIFAYANEASYKEFCEHELAERACAGYPPCARLLGLELANADDDAVERDALELAKALRERADDTTKILGPTRPPVWKIRNVCLRMMYLKGPSFATMLDLLGVHDALALTSTVNVILNPLQ